MKIANRVVENVGKFLSSVIIDSFSRRLSCMRVMAEN
jgi:hypothetical protein